MVVPAPSPGPTQEVQFLTGLEAIVRGIVARRAWDRELGLNTAGFISGYRGSPLGGLDYELWKSEQLLRENQIEFRPGLNEDLAATACWGTQQVPLIPRPKYDGVFAFWYGKGPGLDRSGDAIKHGNFAGTSPRGGVVLLVGDDHGCKSSTVPHQSEQALVAAGIPIFNPASIEDYVRYIPVAVEMSRFASLWTAFKCITEVVESSMTVSVDAGERWLPRAQLEPLGEEFSIRLGYSPLQQEESLVLHRLPAAQRFVLGNGLDVVTRDASKRTLGIIAPGKSHVDVLEALRILELGERRLRELGIRIYKPLLTWPLEPTAAVEFCRSHAEVLVVEEKRSFVEDQLARLLLRLPAGQRPTLTGKSTPQGAPLLPQHGELSPLVVAEAIGLRLEAMDMLDETLRHRLHAIRSERQALSQRPVTPAMRVPAFCSGCPHNRSTRIPEGSMAFGGIGCHGMALWVPELRTLAATHMGGEGTNWIGIQPFTDTPHIFQNMGDGTYAHSGSLAIRAAIAAGSNITFKILHNAAAAMTGGQTVEGNLSAADIARQLQAEGVRKVVIVSEEPARHESLRGRIEVHHRDELLRVEAHLREIRGVTALVYEQGCAAERRRLRKQGLHPDPPVRAFINTEVCEGCGDCNAKSNCVSVLPLETELGRKRRIDQESCNKDYTCIEGFCPSFVTVKGGKLRQGTSDAQWLRQLEEALVEPKLPPKSVPYNIVVAGIGGTGIITLGSIVARAAMLDGQRVATLDVTGLAQKNGPVYTHIRLLDDALPGEFRPRVPEEQLDLLIGCDIVGAAAAGVMPLLKRGRTRAVVNHSLVPTAAFQRNTGLNLQPDPFHDALTTVLSPDSVTPVVPVEGERYRVGHGPLLNLYMLGFAWQKGLIPLTAASIEAAMSGSGNAKSILAFRVGRLAAQDPALARRLMAADEQGGASIQPLSERPYEVVVERCASILEAYQNRRYADEYREFVERVRARDPHGEFAHAVARNLFRMMRYKDEYEVARLYRASQFRDALQREFEGDYRVHFNFAPPLLALRKMPNGEPRKVQLGPWVYPMLGLLTKLKFLRGTPFDLFGYSNDRRLERALIREYRQWVEDLLPWLAQVDYSLAVEIAQLPEQIKGYGPVKARNAAAARRKYMELSASLNERRRKLSGLVAIAS
jgi:indolepyruvate ferredoxin oxidoreductase